MGRSIKIMLTLAAFAFVNAGLSAQDYLTKDGKLTHPLKLTELQGGFAGFTGVQITIAIDGSWTSETVFNKKPTPKDKGQLSAKEMTALAELLTKYELKKLPVQSGKQPGANPHSIAIEFGALKANITGAMPPALDAANPTGTVESRFAGIWEGVGRLTAPKGKKAAGE